MSQRTALAAQFPFDAMAADYDAAFGRTPLGHLLREEVASEIDHHFRPGRWMLDLGCGTGEDALRLARRGVRVHGVDASESMVANARAKAADLSNAPLFEVVDLNLDRLPPGPFDAALGNFGVLNCVPDRRAFAGRLSRVIEPGGRALFVVMGRRCPWEWLWYLIRMQPKTAFRRLSGEASFRGMAVYYPSPREVADDFHPHFRFIRTVGIGLLLPPTFAAGAIGQGWIADGLAAMERRLRSIPGAAGLSDHFLIELERR